MDDNAPDPYAQVAAEIDAGQIDKPLWVRAFAEAGGDEARTKVAYIQHRARKVQAIYQQALLEARQLGASASRSKAAGGRRAQATGEGSGS